MSRPNFKQQCIRGEPMRDAWHDEGLFEDPFERGLTISNAFECFKSWVSTVSSIKGRPVLPLAHDAREVFCDREGHVDDGIRVSQTGAMVHVEPP